MAKSSETMSISTEEAYFLSIIHSMAKIRSISLIIQLKIPELICDSDSAMNIEEIAEKSGCDATNLLYPVMKALAQWGIGKELENKHFCKNKALELLRRDKGPSIAHYFQYRCSDEHFSALLSLGECVKHGKPAFVLEHGMTHFEYMNDLKKSYCSEKMFKGTSEHQVGSLSRRVEFTDNYCNAMAYSSHLLGVASGNGEKNLHNAFPWSTCEKIMDLGGGTGSFLASILKLPGCEHIQGYVVDLPHVVEEAKTNINALRIPEQRITFVQHDLLKPFPRNSDLQGDTLVLKHIFCSFVGNRDQVKSIFANCCILFPSKGGRLLVIDQASPDDKNHRLPANGLDYGSQSVHYMSINATAYILTKREWTELFHEVGKDLGYQLQQIHDTFYGGDVIFELSYNSIA